MTPTELHTAVMASSGSLEHELCARVWCAGHCKEYHGYRLWNSGFDNPALFINDALGGVAVSFAWHERPDISTDAALDLMRVRFPNAYPSVWECKDGGWRAVIRGSNRVLYAGTHKDRRLAILAALLKAMGE